MTPEVSVIVPVYNREALVGRAIASLRAQSLSNIEIIVVDDGSTDGSAAVVEAIDDERIELVRHERNKGIPQARNTGLERASGRYIAWLDSDDTARPERLATQLRFLDANPTIAMLGAAAGRIRGGRRIFGDRQPPQAHEDIQARLLFRSAFQQSSIMGRSEILRDYPYRPEFPVCEDIDMFIRLTRDHRVANLRDVLIDRHLHAGQTVQRESRLVVEKKKILFRDSLQRLGIIASDEELEKHVLLGNLKKATVDRSFLAWSEEWLARLVSANRQAEIYDSHALAGVATSLLAKARRNARRWRWKPAWTAGAKKS